MAERIVLTDRWLKANKTGDRQQGDAGCKGLYFQIRGTSRSWIFRWSDKGKARVIGIGSYPDVGLHDARGIVDTYRQMIAKGIDPKAERERLAAEEAAKNLTFLKFALQYIDEMGRSWVPLHRKKWRHSIEVHCRALADKRLADITTEDVITALKPLLDEGKLRAFSVTRGRIEAVINSATAKGYRSGVNPAQWAGHLKLLIRTPPTTVKHHASVPWRDLPPVMASAMSHESIAAKALVFTILTATRAGESTGARWSEIDLDSATWVIPADRMKMSREHRIPLCSQAVAILQSIPRTEGGDLVFVNNRDKQVSGDVVRLYLVKKLEVKATVHGFRASFRTWAAETGVDRQAAELALAHDAGDNAVERAYYRTDLLEQRRAVMQNWADTICRDPAANVLPFGRVI